MEKTAAGMADCFTTVSQLTARECQEFLEKEADLITPNGFENEMVPEVNVLEEKRSAARNKLAEVAAASLGYEVKDNCLFIATSGRHEFRNKGFDVFIDAIARLASDYNLEREIIAYILVPAAHTQPREEIMSALSKREFRHTAASPLSTHYLQEQDHDQIYQKIANAT